MSAGLKQIKSVSSSFTQEAARPLCWGRREPRSGRHCAALCCVSPGPQLRGMASDSFWWSHTSDRKTSLKSSCVRTWPWRTKPAVVCCVYRVSSNVTHHWSVFVVTLNSSCPLSLSFWRSDVLSAKPKISQTVHYTARARPVSAGGAAGLSGRRALLFLKPPTQESSFLKKFYALLLKYLNLKFIK